MEPLIKHSRIEQWRKQRAEKKKNKRRLPIRKMKTRSHAWKLSASNGTERDVRVSKRERKLSKT